MGTIILAVSYFSFAYATALPDRILAVPTLFAIALAPFVFVAVAFISRNPRGARRVLQAMALLFPIALVVGLLVPVIGAAAGFGVGMAVTLNEPGHPDVLRNRLIAVAFSVVYAFVLMVVGAVDAGIMTGALLPPVIIGLADEFTVWRASTTEEGD